MATFVAMFLASDGIFLQVGLKGEEAWERVGAGKIGIAAPHASLRLLVTCRIAEGGEGGGVSVEKECRGSPQKGTSWDSQNVCARWGG